MNKRETEIMKRRAKKLKEELKIRYEIAKRNQDHLEMSYIGNAIICMEKVT